MTISSTSRKAGPYAGNDVATAFPFAFKVFGAADLYVVRADSAGAETVLALGTDYTVALNSNQDTNPGGTVTLPAALASTYTLTIASQLENLQPTDLTNQGGFYPKVITNALDRLTILVQQVSESVSRSLKTSISTPSGVSSQLPTPVAGNVLGWNVTATEIVNYAAQAGTSLIDLAAPGGAALVGIKQSGIGAVVRTVEAKAMEVVSADDYTTLQQAVDSLPSGGICWLPKATRDFSTLSVPAGVTLRGEGAYASVLRTTHATANAITLHTSSALVDLKVMTSVTKTAGFLVDVQGNGAILDNCEFGGYYIGVSVGTIGGSIIVGTRIKDCEFRQPAVASGCGAMQFLNFSNADVSDCIVAGDVGTQASFGIRFQNGDTAFVRDTNITLHGKALLVDTPAGYNCYALTITGGIFDSAGTITGGATVSSAEFIPAGGVYNTRITGAWFGLSASKSGCYLAPSGAGVVDGITFTGCEFTDNGDCGLIAVGTGVKNWIVTGGHAGGNTNSGVRAAGGTSDFCITGIKAGNISGRGPNNVGITVDAAASANYLIADNVVTGNTTSAISDSGSGSNARVTNNIGYNGATAAAALTVTASPYTYTAGHCPETIYVMAGTVSAISIDGVTVQNTTGSTVQLQPNQAATITYSVLPTVVRKIN